MFCSTLQLYDADASQTVSLAGGSLSQSVFHWSEPQILTATTAGSLAVWHVTEDLAANHSLPTGEVKVFPLQKAPITALSVTDR